MKYKIICSLSILFGVSAHASAIDLGSANLFAILAGSTVTNTGPSSISGNLGVSPGTAITGFPPGSITGIFHTNDGVVLQAQNDLATAYNAAVAAACGTDLSGQNLGGLTLTPGVYCFTTASQLTGILTLNSLGDPNAVFIFKIGSTLTTSSASSVAFSNGGKGGTVFWQVGSSATLGATTAFAGNLLALTSVTLGTGASISCGRALAQNGAVTLDTNDVEIDSIGCAASEGSATPEPSTLSLFLLAGTVGFAWFGKTSRRAVRAN